MLGHTKSEGMLVITAVKCLKQNMGSDIIFQNTRVSTGLDAKHVKKVLTRRHFTRNTTVHSFVNEFGVDLFTFGVDYILYCFTLLGITVIKT